MMSTGESDHDSASGRDGIYLRNVCLSYSNRQENVLNGVDLNASKGKIYGLLGPSGCGKSTLIRCTLGLQKPDFGDVRLFNHPPSKTCIGIPGPNVGYMPQEIALYDLLSIQETMTYFGRVFGLSGRQAQQRTMQLAELLMLHDLGQEIGTMSGGQRRRVSFAVAVMNRCPLIVLDEPTAGVDPLLRQRLWNYLQQLCCHHQCTVLITTHYIEEARRADRIGFMRKGRILCEGSPTDLLRSHQVATLEQVFLQLCQRKRKSTIASASELLQFKQAYQRERYAVNAPHLDNETSNRLQSVRFQNGIYDVPAMRDDLKQFDDCGELPIPMDSFDVEHKLSVSVHPSKYGPVLIWLQILTALVVKNLAIELRNPLQASLQFASPLAQVLLFGLCIGRAPTDIPIAVHSQEFSFLNLSNRMIESLKSPNVHLIPYSNHSQAIEHVRQGRLWALMSIPRLFSHAFIERQAFNVSNSTIRHSTVILYADLTNRIVSDLTLRHLNHGYRKFVRQQLHEYSLESRFSDTYISFRSPLYGQLYGACDRHCFTAAFPSQRNSSGATKQCTSCDLRPGNGSFEFAGQRNYMIPGVIVNLGFAISIALSSLPLIDERGKQTLERHFALGIQSSQVMMAHGACRLLLHVPYAILMLVLPNLLFQTPLFGSLTLAIALLVLQGACGSAFGVLLAALSQNLLMAMVGTSGAFIVCLFGSGTLWPIESVPVHIRPVVLLLPTTLSTTALRNVMLKGWTLTHFQVWPAFVVTGAWSLLLFLVGIHTFKMTNH